VLPELFYLNDVMVTPDLVQSLLSVCYFIVRYNSSGPLYTILLPASATSIIDAPLYALAVVALTTTWHHRLGHPDPEILSQLSRSLVITCPRASSESLCHACQLGRHIRLLFPSYSSRVVHPFDLIHCDLWTSPIASVSGYKYYFVILDDCTHYSWTFPLCHKSNTFPTLSHCKTSCYGVTKYFIDILIKKRIRGKLFLKQIKPS
jgi:hypothetical protein